MKEILFCTALLFTSCSKEGGDFSPPPSQGDSRLKISWFTSFSDGNGGVSMKPQIIDSLVVFSVGFGFNNGIKNPLVYLDSSSGLVKSIWADYLTTPDLIDKANFCSSNEFVCIGDFENSTFINLRYKTTLQKLSVGGDSPSPYRSSVNGKVYQAVSYNGFLPSLNAALLELNYALTGIDTVYKINASNSSNYGVNINRVSGEVATNGDEILYFMEEDYTGVPFDEPNRVVALNRTKDTILWKFTCNERTGNRTLAPTIDGNRLYVSDHYKVYCLNKSDGSLVWTYSHSPSGELGTTLLVGDRLVYNNYILVKGQDERLVCLNKNIGAVVWTNANTGASMDGVFEEFEGKLYFIAGARLQIVDIQSGDQLLTVKEQSQFGHLYSSVTIDPVRRVMYFSSDRYAYCVKIPEL